MLKVVLVCLFSLSHFLGVSMTDVKNFTISYVKVDADMDGTVYSKNILNTTEEFEIVFTLKSSSDYDYKLTQNGENITVGSDLEKSDARVDMSSDTITIKVKSDPARSGVYLLNLVNKEDSNNKVTKKFTIFSPPFVQKFTKSKRVLEGDPTNIQCVAYGYPTPVIMWSRDLTGTEEVSAGPGLDVPWNVTANKTTLSGDTLVFESMQFSDSGLYQCNATNSLGSDISIIKVRVKDRLAALWPFIGIVIEVAILVTIILVYEKKRANSKKKLADDDAQPMSDAKEKDADGNDLRQRNVKA